ncbi:hypothetical protein VMCG_01645 [Cytospora schulzeri]|uniref:Xylanolytic transcriptional activator regulatory domain-containing protein n=1 Tax=Cytospora schulzeri TaxID=448051 RepID=A0A423X3B3_9PEZI|nr:hypothetical protein VMCG_01645 [Valsa malicola]
MAAQMFDPVNMDMESKTPIQSVGPSPDLPASSVTPGPAPAIKRRAPIACRSIFPVRGQPDNDRDYRHPRSRTDKAQKRDSAKMRRDILDAPVIPAPVPLKNVKGVDPWDYLPPLPDVIEAVNQFTRNYFQLGFIPKQAFPDRLRTDHRSISVFLLLSILSISARFTPALVERYGGGMKAAETFMDRASAVALTELYEVPTLERCQAFYLLSVAQQGSGLKNKSYINVGIAMRMAALMRLHREETYTLQNPSKEMVIAAESARRTLWQLHSQDNLHSGPESPVSLAASDITALLPCSEDDFAKGQEPQSRAALEDTPPAVENPKLISDPRRSLFATLIQTHYFWGRVIRRAVKYDRSSRPWEDTSEYAELVAKLHEWESNLPHEHLWSPVLLKGYKAGGQDLGYLSITNSTRLCNIVLRKAYLSEMINLDQSDPQLQTFWSNMSLELFKNVKLLHEQIETQFLERAPDDSLGAQMALFCVFSCGHMATYLCRYPNVCPDPSITRDGPIMLQRAMTILTEASQVWPLAARWLENLHKFFRDNKGAMPGMEGSMADSRDPVPEALQEALARSPSANGNGANQAASQEDNQQDRSGEASSATIIQAPPQVPTPMMYIDPNMRMSQGQAAMPQQHLGERPAADGLGLLLEAFDSHQAGANMAATGTGQPYDANVAATQAGYYGQPGTAMPGNDGYENELQFYIDGAPTVQGWVGTGAGAGAGPGMYGY